MTLTSGTRLGPYEVVAAIGAGGMGEVLRAKDTKLGRDVAIKVLPAAFAQDPERLEEAHEHGIVHRDLKPANIKLTPNGEVKVLDFAWPRLARATERAAPPMSPTPPRRPATPRRWG